jgi:hypothetical protein
VGTKIPWCDDGLGCTQVSDADRWGRVQWGDNPRVRTSDELWDRPFRLNRLAARRGLSSEGSTDAP